MKSVNLSVKVLAAFLILSVALQTETFAQTATPYVFSTRDRISIAASLYTGTQASTSGRSLLIVAPGFAATKDSVVLSALCPSLATDTDVLCFDFRGTGESQGRFEFGAKEQLDFEPILKWARRSYASINLMGFSLGAYSSMRAAALWPDSISHLLLVSCPTDLIDIITSGGVITNVTHILLRPDNPENQTGANIFFRWGNPFSPEPNLTDLSGRIHIPVSFLVGSKDALVYNRLSQRVFDSIPGQKTWDVFPDGEHADAMYIQHPKEFVDWVVKRLHDESQ